MENEILLETEELLQRLVEAVEKLNSAPSEDTIIAFFALVAAWITIAFLLVERHEKNRPYLQISFELVRSTLACIVLRNTGSCPLEIKSLEFSKNFTQQLSPEVQERLNKKSKTNIAVFPNRQWVISFDVNVFDILKKFEVKEVEINYTKNTYGNISDYVMFYSKTGKYKRKYKEKISIDFEEYRGILDYISELDEFKNSVDKLNKSMIRFIDISKIDDSVEQRIKEQGADSQQ